MLALGDCGTIIVLRCKYEAVFEYCLRISVKSLNSNALINSGVLTTLHMITLSINLLLLPNLYIELHTNRMP